MIIALIIIVYLLLGVFTSTLVTIIYHKRPLDINDPLDMQDAALITIFWPFVLPIYLLMQLSRLLVIIINFFYTKWTKK